MKAAANKPLVCYVTDRRSLSAAGTEANAIEGVVQSTQVALAARVDWVQLREKDLPAGQLLDLARRIVRFAEERVLETERQSRIIINDRLDVALAARADGVHLGRESAPAHEVVRWCRAGNAPERFVIGVSCHSIDEAREAENAKTDYIFFGPVFQTPSKQPFGAPQGIERLAEVCRTVEVPVIAIGGVRQENAASCIRAGASGIAAIRMFQESPDPKTIRESVASIQSLDGKEI